MSLARALNGNGFRVTACGLSAEGGIRSAFDAFGVEACVARSTGGSEGFDPALLLGLARLLRAKQVDILHCHSKLAHFYGALAARAARVPVVCTRHGTGALFCGLAHRGAAQFASHYVAVCQAALAEAVRRLHINKARASVIYNGIDTAQFAIARAPAHWARPHTVLGCVARLSREKNHATLLEAVGHLVVGGLDVHLELAGGGPLRDDLRKAAQELGIEDRVRFLGMVKNVPQFLKRCHVFVLPSFSEGLPLSVIEAMASGLPVVATSVGGLPELVREGETGFLVSPRSSRVLAEALGKVLSSPDLCYRMGEEGQRVAVRSFDVSRMADSYAALYRRLLQERR